jgi:hypothetical protein
MNKHVNYDEIAPTYNQRFTVDNRQYTALAILAFAQAIHAKRILGDYPCLYIALLISRKLN